MKYHQPLKRILALAAGLVFGTASSQAALTYHVEIATSSLIGSASGPFSLDFQLNGEQGNTATVSSFTFSGGSATPGTEATFNMASGSLGSTVTLGSTSAVNFFNEFFQEFTPGSILGFDVTLTNDFNSAVPDAFSVAILDGSLANIPTTGLGDSLLLINLYNSPTVEASAGTGAFAGVTVTAVPLASGVPDNGTTFALLGVTLAGMAGLRRKLRAP